MTASLADHRVPQRGGAAAGGSLHKRVAPLRLVPQPEGLLQIYTAPFRGSVGSVFSQALRSAGLGSRVLVCQCLKGGVDQGTAGALSLCGRLQWLRPNTPQCIGVSATLAGPEAVAAVVEIWANGQEQLVAGGLDLVVFDELGLAIELGYLAANEVTDTLSRRPPHVDVILTGPSMPPELMAMADQVTQLRRGL
ncbi:MAG: cob(I)yrinic acid a,c-diamide adenosyltransferase [Cyanobacteriota bacterium]|nr:cob(I)yrinic acid a,c-diamide adenosyltransferase [Cyanobacteriota bacterium]